MNRICALHCFAFPSASRCVALMMIALTASQFAWAQSVGIGTSTPHPKALLEISSDSMGVLFPRLTTVQRNGIVSPPKGLFVYDSSARLIFYHDGFLWQGIAPLSRTWGLGGNSSTNPSNDFIGTSDNRTLNFRVNNIRAGLIDHLNKNVLLGS